jgi:Kef-type K+ transport system membrane component KefB
MIAMILSTGGFWISDDRCIAILGVIFLAFFLGMEVGEKRSR